MRPVRAQQLNERLTRREAAHLLEFRRFLERAAQDETEHAAETADHKRDAPAIHGHQRRVEPRAHRQAHRRCRGHTHRYAREHHAADERRNPRRGLNDVGQRAGQLATEAEALQQPEHHHQETGRHAPLRIGRHQAHAQCRRRHHEHRPQEHRAPAIAIAVVGKHDAAERARQVAHGKRRERRHQRRDRRRAGEYGRGDVAGEHAEDDEVVELERAAKAGQQHDAPSGRGDAIGRGTGRSGCHRRHGLSQHVLNDGEVAIVL